MVSAAQGTSSASASADSLQTILFFGDSITRGFGVGRQARFAALLETAFRARGHDRWRVAVAYGRSYGPMYIEGLERAMQRHRPQVLVCQCPIGALLLWPQYPLWIRSLQRLFGYFFAWRRE